MEYQLVGKLEVKDSLNMAIRHNIRLLILMTIVLVIAFAMSLLTGNYLWALLIVLYFFLVAFIFNRQARKSYNSSPALQDEQHYVIDKKAIHSFSGGYESKITKDAVVKISCFDDAIYVYLAKRNAFILKKSWLKKGNWTEFTKFMEENYQKGK